MFEHINNLFDVTDSLYATLFIMMLYWADKRIKSNEKRAEDREERLLNKVEEMEKRYIEREDRYQEVVNTLSLEIVSKVESIENEVHEIKQAIKEK